MPVRSSIQWATAQIFLKSAKGSNHHRCNSLATNIIKNNKNFEMPDQRPIWANPDDKDILKETLKTTNKKEIFEKSLKMVQETINKNLDMNKIIKEDLKVKEILEKDLKDPEMYRTVFSTQCRGCGWSQQQRWSYRWWLGRQCC